MKKIHIGAKGGYKIQTNSVAKMLRGHSARIQDTTRETSQGVDATDCIQKLMLFSQES